MLPAVSDDRSGTCRVLDVSGSGVGLEVYGPWPRTVVGEELVLRLDPGEDGTGGYELRGVVRNSARTKFGFARAGVEFPALTTDERTCLRSLAERRSVKL